ncbi:MAG: hypothetical protein HQK96_09840 [Nitrospirae bacterium]|nr:hypothetical protein [Nitrospirota bacterium]
MRNVLFIFIANVVLTLSIGIFSYAQALCALIQPEHNKFDCVCHKNINKSVIKKLIKDGYEKTHEIEGIVSYCKDDNCLSFTNNLKRCLQLKQATIATLK